MGSPAQRRNRLLVRRVDPLEAVDLVEGAVGGEDGVDPAVDRQGGEDGIAGIKALVELEEVDPALHIGGLDRVPPGEPRDMSRGFGGAVAVSGAASSLVEE